MAKLSVVYRSRARRVRVVQQKALGEESQVVLRGIKEGVEVEMYQRTPLRVTGKMRSSIQPRFLGNSFAIVYAASVAPYAANRATKKGISPSGGHLLDMNPAGYMRIKYGAVLGAVKRRHQREVAGGGVTCLNGN